ncbi:Chromosome-associated kinesin kif4a, partial [Rhizopus azygosporus]
MSVCTVRVALRVRPLLEKEETKSCITFIPNQPQVIVDQNRQFTFDHVYSPSVTQEEVYLSCIQPLFDQFVKGYNATVLAYGQTGSGKTYNMGTSYHHQDPKHYGIVP